MDSRIDELIFEGADYNDDQRPCKAVTINVSRPQPAYAEPPDVEGRMGGFVQAPSPREEPNHATSGTTIAIAPLLGMQKEAMSEMLRVDGFLRG